MPGSDASADRMKRGNDSPTRNVRDLSSSCDEATAAMPRQGERSETLYKQQGSKPDTAPSRIGDFTIVREIGRGGMGIVYEAIQETLKRRVALKILPFNERMNERQILRFQNEARAAAQLNHPNIVSVYSIGTESGFHYYAMQLVAGDDVAHFIKQAKQQVDSRQVSPSGFTPGINNAPTLEDSLQQTASLHPATEDSESRGKSTVSFPSADFIEMMSSRSASTVSRKTFDSVIRIGIQAADALHYAHQLGIVHRDIKPSNLLLDDRGNVWVADFGLAQIQGAGALTMTGEVIGTLRYMSPEQPLGQRVLVDQRTDIYSLGITLYELLTLTKAYNGDSPKEIIRQVCFDEPIRIRRLNPCIPDDLETIILKAIAKHPDERYQTAQEFADDLRRFREDLPIMASRPGLLQRCRSWVRRHVALATTIAAFGFFSIIVSLTATGMIWSSLNQQTIQRKRAESLLDTSEGLRFIANANLMKAENPGLALLLAIRGTELNPGVDANSALLSTMGLNREVRTLTPRSVISETIAVSPDGTKIVTTAGSAWRGHGNHPAIESDVESGRTLLTFDDGSAITSAAYSPDGKFLLTAAGNAAEVASAAEKPASVVESDQSPAVLWDAHSGDRLLTFLETASGLVSMACFSPESERVVLAGSDNAVRIYATRDAQLLSVLKGHTKPVVLASFSDDGQQVVSASLDNTVRVWDVKSGTEKQSFAADFESVRDITVAFTGLSDQIMISTVSGTRLLSIDTGLEINRQHWPESVFRLSRDGQIVALFDRFDKRVTIRNLRSLERITTIRTPDRILSVDLSDDGMSLLTTTIKEALIFSAADGTLTSRLQGHSDRVVEGRFLPGGERVITSSRDGTVRCWNAQNGNARQQLLEQISRIAPSPWSISDDSTHTIAVPKPVWRSEILNADGSPAASGIHGYVAEHTSGLDRLVTLDDQHVYVTHGPTSRQLAVFNATAGMVLNAKAIEGTDVVAILLDTGEAILWNTQTDQRTVLSDPQERVVELEVHPSSHRLALVQENGDCIVFDTATHEILRTFSHQHQAVCVQFDKSGSRILTVDSHGTTRLWNPDQETEVQIFQQPDVHCNRARFSGDETSVLTWCNLKQAPVLCWQVDSGKLLGETHPVEMADVKCHPTRPIATVSSSKNGLLLWDWSAGTQRQLTTSAARSPIFLDERVVTIEANPEFVVSKPAEFVYQREPEFARASIVTRDLNSGNILSQQSPSVEPVRLAVDAVTGQLLHSFKAYGAAVIRMEDHRNLATVGNHAGPPTFVCLTGSGNNLKAVCTSMDGTATISSLSGRLLHRLSGHLSPIINAAVSPDDHNLAVFHASGSGALWNLVDGTKISDFEGHSTPVHSVQFSQSGTRLVTASAESLLIIRDLVSRTEKTIAFATPVLHAEWSPNERSLLVILSESRQEGSAPDPQNRSATAIMLEIETGIQIPLQAPGTAKSGCVSPDGNYAVVCSAEGTATLINATDGKAVANINLNRRPVFHAAFSPDSRELLIRHDGELSLWELQSGIEVCRIPEAARQYWGGAMPSFMVWKPFTPDGGWILSATPSLQKWPRDPITEAVKQAPRTMTPGEQQRFSVNMLKAGVSPEK